MAPRTTGYAVRVGDRIDILTVRTTRRSTVVKWLRREGHRTYRWMSDLEVEAMWNRAVGIRSATIEVITVAVVPYQTPIQPEDLRE